MARRRALAIPVPPRVNTRLVRRIVAGVVILGLACLIVLVGAAGFFSFRIMTQHNDAENVTPGSFLLTNFENVSFTDHQGGVHDGWLLRGLKGAPVIILCPGYDSNRSDLLSLGAVLQENHFNIYIFNFHGPGTRRTFSNLGVSQADDLQAAIESIIKQPDINTHRVGLFGATTGGYAALVAAQRSNVVKALAVDSVYETPIQMLDAQIMEVLGGPSPLVKFIAEREFRLFTWRTKTPQVRENLSKLSGIPKMFISGRDAPLLASSTEDLYNAAPDPKTLRVLEHSQSSQTGGAEKKEYENQILSFFLQNLPLRAD